VCSCPIRGMLNGTGNLSTDPLERLDRGATAERLGGRLSWIERERESHRHF
jgi:hypothetical protein